MQFGLIGHPLSHSFSPEVHRCIGAYSYELCDLAPDALADFFARRDFRGINVTIPYKEAVLPYLDELSPRAAAIGAVNTILNRGGRLYGDNTDFAGMQAALSRAGIDPKGKTVFILGTGGTAKTARAVAAAAGAKRIRLVSRTGRGGALTYEQAVRDGSAEILINATPCGMFPAEDRTPIGLDAFPRLCGVFDAVFNPQRTRLVQSAQKRGVLAEGGLFMLAMQAVESAKLFGFDADIETVYCDVLRRLRNIVLIGMPGVGKTRVGTRLSELLGVPFCDSDKVLTARIGMRVSDWFAQYDEASFRTRESEVIAELSRRHGIVLSTGGGSLLRQENAEALRRNGFLIWLDRPTEELKVGGDRPLSMTREQVRALYDTRRPLYEAAADAHIRSGRNFDETAHMILEIL